MADGAIVFALANPVPEVQPEAVYSDVAIMATGRSDYPNQINNVLAFPGIFRGALDVRARTIDEGMKLAAARAAAQEDALDVLAALALAGLLGQHLRVLAGVDALDLPDVDLAAEVLD